ncbi:hypothetical protein [Flavobacterium sp.]|uniref:hypothetical protein n=1 Tax=Flavobacterium sp. TaxID=239 RepID=UPI0025C042D5|nr:hypothetical protein [Flavobacterium sp.]
MNLFKIFQRLYMEYFSWAFDNEFDLDRTFNDLNNFHTKALPTSEDKKEQLYAKIFKSNAFYLLSPVIFIWLRYQVMKFSSAEYLQSLINKSIENED